MSRSEWRALLLAYADGRLGADTFRRRFLEAFEAAARARRPVPPPIQDLFFTVEAYGGDPMGRGHAVSDDAELTLAAQAALRELGEGADAFAEPPPRIEPVRVVIGADGPTARRFVWRLGAAGGLGCVAVLAYVGIGVLQFFAVAAQIQAVTQWGPAPSTLAGLLLAFMPIIGSVIAFFGAADVWNWPWPAAAAVFFALPALSLLGGWVGWRRR